MNIFIEVLCSLIAPFIYAITYFALLYLVYVVKTIENESTDTDDE